MRTGCQYVGYLYYSENLRLGHRLDMADLFSLQHFFLSFKTTVEKEYVIHCRTH